MFTRRAFLKSGGLALTAAGVGGLPAFLARTAQATSPLGAHARRKTLVAIFQRGAMDGIMAVQPLSDPHLERLRPRLVMSGASRVDAAERLIDLDGQFGLHPSLRPLARHFQDGAMGIVHGVGSPVPTRSHFDAQDYMETGLPGQRRARSGWLNRAVGELGHEAPATPFRAVALTPASVRVRSRGWGSRCGRRPRGGRGPRCCRRTAPPR